MNFFKVILALVVLFLAVLGAFAVFGLVAWLFKYLVFFGVIFLVGAVAYKVLKKDDRPAYQLEELRRRQLTK